MARYHDQTAIYEVAKTFAEDCFLGNGSLLWPDQRVWTEANLGELWKALVENPDTGGDNYVTKLAGQLAGQPADVYRLMAEATAFYCLFPSSSSIGSVRKRGLVEEVLAMLPDLTEPDFERWNSLLAAFEGNGIGSTGTGYNTARDNQLAFVLAFAITVKENGIKSFDELDPRSTTRKALDMIGEVRNYRPYAALNIMLHLLWPDDYEGTASNEQKTRIATSLSKHFDLPQKDDVEESILQARRHMEEIEGLPKDFNMYSDDVRPLWDVETPKKPKAPKTPISGKSDNEHSPTSPPPPIADLAAATHLEESYLREIEALLRDKKQLIFEGPPGSGKTFVAEKFARYFTGQPVERDDRNDQIELVQFHQSYSYEDFVEGIRPETNDAGQLVYGVKKGIFREFADKAELNPDKKFVLIIDEINRGNVSRILGELMLLLEYRDKSATLQYSQEALRIPKNLYIIGTMNSADRSLSQIDYALRRRFYFVRFMSVENGAAPVLQGWLKARNVADSEPVALFVRLNERIRQHMHTDDLQVGHSYFMREDIGDEHMLNQVWKYAVMPLLREYFYHQKDREDLLRSFELEHLTVKPNETVVEIETEATDVDNV